MSGPAPEGPWSRLLIHEKSLVGWHADGSQQPCWCRGSLAVPAPDGGPGTSCVRTCVPVEQLHRQLRIFERHTVVPVPERQQHGSRFASTCKRVTVMRDMRLCQEGGIASSHTGGG